MDTWGNEQEYLLLAAIKHHHRLFSAVRSRGEDADDILQECRIACWRALRKGTEHKQSTIIYRAVRWKLAKMFAIASRKPPL